MTFGVKTYNSMRKNDNSVGDYHILSNLTNEQHDDDIAYDGFKKEAENKKTTN